MLFKDTGLKAGLLKGVLESGYEETTDIQEKVIPRALEGKNIIGQSQTGTGKTAAFLLPLLNSIDTNLVETQALILAPTRELVVQIFDEIYKFTKYYRVPAATLFGGVSQVNQVTEINRKPRILIATPGRLWDFVEQKLIDLRTVKYFVLDEVDRMLDMGFSKTIDKIRAKTSRIKQTYSFSATLNDEILNVVKTHVKDFELIKSGSEILVDKINHSYVSVAIKDKFINLTKLLNIHKGDKIVVFTNTINNSDVVYKRLLEEGYKVGTINGDMNQSKRLTTLNAFVKGDIKILVTTDVAARGLNMQSIGLVINFDFPKELEAYIHRIGRTARAGEYGKAISFVSSSDQHRLEELQAKYKITVKRSDYNPISDVESTYKGIRLDNVGTTNSSKSSDMKPRKSMSRAPKNDYSERNRSYDKSYDKDTEKRRGDERSFKDVKESYKKYGDKMISGNSYGEKKFGNRTRKDKKPFEERGNERKFGRDSTRKDNFDKKFGDRGFDDKKPFGRKSSDKQFGEKGRTRNDSKFSSTKENAPKKFSKYSKKR